MKQIQGILFVFALLIPPTSLFSQMDTEGLISSSGTSLVGENMIIDYSMGVWTSLNMDNSNGQITNGIQQSDYLIITSLTQVKQQVKMNVYPNPTVGNIQLDIDDKINVELNATLRSAEGKVLHTQLISKSTSINLEHLPAQVYYLSISNPDGKNVEQFKIIKIQ